MPNSTIKEMLPTNADQAVYLLLDGATFPAMRHLYQYEASPKAVPLFFGTRHDSLMEVSPCLYQPSTDSSVWSHEEEWRQHGVVLVSESPFLDVLAHLKRLVSVQLPSGQLAYWRFYSPDWLPTLMACFSHEEQARFTGPITQWAAWRNDHWERHTILSHQAPDPVLNDGEFVLSQRCLDALSHADEAAFYAELDDTLRRVLTEEHAATVNRASSQQWVQRARQLGFQRHADLTWFVLMHYAAVEKMQQPDILAVLENTTLTPHARQQRVDALRHGLETQDVEQ